MKAYSEDLRQKIVDVIERGMPKAEAARTFGVGISTVKRYATKALRGESLEPAKAPGKPPKMDEQVRKLLEEDLKERPFVTLRERCDYHVSRHSPDRFDAQKGGRSATERDEFLRAAWRVMVAAEVDPERLVFVDEMGVHTSLAPLYGYSAKGERVRLSVPRNLKARTRRSWRR
jgi:transposase-like protein